MTFADASMPARPGGAQLGKVRFEVRNTFVEIVEDDDGSQQAEQPALRRAETEPFPSTTSDDEAALASQDHVAGVDDDSSSSQSYEISVASEASTDNTDVAADPSRKMGAESEYACCPKRKAIEDFARADRVSFAVKNTFVEIVDDDRTPSRRPQRIGRAGTEPLAQTSCHEDADDVVAPVAQWTADAAGSIGNGVSGRVWHLSQDSDGSRLVQMALDEGSEQECVSIARELQSHVVEALEDPHANYVLQKCVTLLHPQSFQFIIDEIMENNSVPLAARSRSGCRVVQRLLECGSRSQTFALGECLLAQTMATCKHRYGKYVMECFVEHGARQHVFRLSETLATDIVTSCLDQHACRVVLQILAPGITGPTERQLLVGAMCMSPGLAAQMSCTQLGAAVVERVNEIAPGCFSIGDIAPMSTRTDVGLPAHGIEKPIRCRRSGAGGGQFAQATAEARDLLESLSVACSRRQPQRITKALLRLEAATVAPDAVPLLHSEAPKACLAARLLLQQLAAHVAHCRTFRRR